MKGLIPAAGHGKRLEPITLAIPKELLMLGDKAVIEYVINAMKSTEITEITIVVGWRKHAILDYLGSGERLGVKITYVVQDKRDGLAKAVLAGEHLKEDGPFLVVLGDNFFYPQTFLKEIVSFHEEKGADATIGVVEVENPTRHGIIKPGENDNIIDVVEKPEKHIFDAIRKTKPGVNQEYQLTDTIKILIEDGKQVCYKKIKGTHIDVGTLEDLRKANAYISNL